MFVVRTDNKDAEATRTEGLVELPNSRNTLMSSMRSEPEVEIQIPTLNVTPYLGPGMRDDHGTHQPLQSQATRITSLPKALRPTALHREFQSDVLSFSELSLKV